MCYELPLSAACHCLGLEAATFGRATFGCATAGESELLAAQRRDLFVQGGAGRVHGGESSSSSEPGVHHDDEGLCRRTPEIRATTPVSEDKDGNMLSASCQAAHNGALCQASTMATPSFFG